MKLIFSLYSRNEYRTVKKRDRSKTQQDLIDNRNKGEGERVIYWMRSWGNVIPIAYQVDRGCIFLAFFIFDSLHK